MNKGLVTFTGTCEIQAASGAGGDGGGSVLPRFTMTAYTGGAMRLEGWDAPVVVDLAGMAIPTQNRPIRLQHKATEGVGHTDKVEVANGTLLAAGVISRATAAAKDVAESGRNGFPWQASIGAKVKKFEFVKAGQSATANGKRVDGPAYVVRESLLGEISFVDLGADGDTSAVVAGKPADGGEAEEGDGTMGGKPENGGTGGSAKGTGTGISAGDGAGAGTGGGAPVSGAGVVEEMRAQAAAETERITALRTLCAEKPEILAKAIRDGWSTERAELEMLRASRSAAPAVQTRQSTLTTTRLLQCAIDMTCKQPEFEKQYEAPVLEATQKRWRGGIGLYELFLEAAHANGYQGSGVRDHAEVMRFAFSPDLCGGFSTVNIPGILSATANKMLLEGFFAIERTWRNICAIRTVHDFKKVTSYRLTGADQYQKVSPSGEIKHGTLGEESYSNQADTYALLLAITRKDIINDDLGAITTAPRKLGRGAGLKINDVFWPLFLDNSTFFTTARKNYAEGAGTALSVDALSVAEAAFMNMVDSDGKPIGANPAILLAAPALSAIVQQLYKGSEIRDNTNGKQYVVSNPHSGKFRPEISRYLSMAAYPGNSARAWYLLADPADVPVIEVAFLNGQEAPTIESAEADFSTLGVQMRGYHDFGVALQDHRGGFKCKGEA